MPYSSSLDLENIPSSLNSLSARNLKWSFAFLRQDFQALGSQSPFHCTWLHSLCLSACFFFSSFLFLIGGFLIFFSTRLISLIDFQRSPTDNVSRYLRWGMTSGWMSMHRRGCWASELRYPISDNPSVHGPAQAMQHSSSSSFQPVFHRPLAPKSCLLRGLQEITKISKLLINRLKLATLHRLWIAKCWRALSSTNILSTVLWTLLQEKASVSQMPL